MTREELIQEYVRQLTSGERAKNWWYWWEVWPYIADGHPKYKKLSVSEPVFHTNRDYEYTKSLDHPEHVNHKAYKEWCSTYNRTTLLRGKPVIKPDWNNEVISEEKLEGLSSQGYLVERVPAKIWPGNFGA